MIANDWAAGVSASQTFTWDVSAVSVSLTSPGNQTNDDGDVVALQLAATDSAGHTLVYSVDPSTPLPSGLTLDPGSGRIYGEVGAGDNETSPYTATLNNEDTPDFAAPLSYYLSNGGAGLVSTTYDEDFQLDIGAQTLCPTTPGTQSLFMEAVATGPGSTGPDGATISWCFLANGAMQNGTWQLRSGGGVIAPTAWSVPTTIVALPTNLEVANTATQNVWFTYIPEG